jgi:hypothetical protein
MAELKRKRDRSKISYFIQETDIKGVKLTKVNMKVISYFGRKAIIESGVIKIELRKS